MKIPPEALPGAYDRFPVITLSDTHPVWEGDEIWIEIRRSALERSALPVIVVDAYPGVDTRELLAVLQRSFGDFDIIDTEEAAAKSSQAIEAMLAHNLTDDRVFGIAGHFDVSDFYDSTASALLSTRVSDRAAPTILLGWGARRLCANPDILILADLARWEIELRQRRGATNWRADNGSEDPVRKYKRGFFVEWPAADQHKRTLFDDIDYLLDTNASTTSAKLITGSTFRQALCVAVRRPLRTVPFFDPGVWGGQWMKQVCDLDHSKRNYAWSFDGVPEANSLLLQIRGTRVEIPAIDLVLARPRELLGEKTFARFGAEFPIRFDLLDTMGGGNLSLQVHPLTDYIQGTFGMNYTQDESYYLLDADEDTVVYLGLRDDVDQKAMIGDLEAASRGELSFPADRYVNTFRAKRHDHFLIPAGTVHCSGANSMVLEISATPFIFTFKMWDWNRVGLDGIPRPIHLEHAKQNIQWDRKTEWVTENLVNRVEVVASGDGWSEERTGLHEFEFIETRRHWFTVPVEHDTGGTVNVLNLVQGREAVIESPTGAFAPYVVHYAETFIIPAAVGRYTIRPYGDSHGERLATIKAFVRGTRRGHGR